MESKKEDKIVIKKSYFWALLFIFGLIVGLSIGYYLGIQTAGQKTEGSVSVGLKAEQLFIKYATDLKLDKKKFESCLNSGKYSNQVKSDFQLGASLGIQGTPSFVVGNNYTSGAQPFSAFQEMIEVELKNKGTNKTIAERLVDGKEPFIGKENAPLTIVEFSDFQCPYCGAFAGTKNNAYNMLKSRDATWSPAFPEMVKNYVQTGKVKYVFRAFPLDIHPNAQKAAEASLCANEQGNYKDYHDRLFEKQDEWSTAA